MTTLMAYADAISVRPGESVGFKVSCEGAAEYNVRIVRLLSPEAGPDAPPFRTEPVETPANGNYPARFEPLHAGSWAIVPSHQAIMALRSFTVQAMIWPTMPGKGRQAIIGTWNETGRSGFGLMIGDDGCVELRLGATVLSLGVKLLGRKWYFLSASYDAESGEISVRQDRLADRTMTVASLVSIQARSERFVPVRGPLLFAAWQVAASDDLPLVGGHFNGKIDSPRLAARALTPAEQHSVIGGPVAAGLATALVGAWDFGRGIDSDTIQGTSPNRLHGTTINLPARAMTG